MKVSKKNEALVSILQKRIKTFSRIERGFYLVLLVTAITMAISIVYLQSRLLQVQQEVTQLNRDINVTKTELNNAKQEISDMIRLERITEAAKKAGLSPQYDNVKKVE